MSSACLRWRAFDASSYEASAALRRLRLPATRCAACHHHHGRRRGVSTSATTTTPTDDRAPSAEATTKRKAPLSKRDRTYLDRALRVNHAGELAATLIYRAQTPLVTRAQPRLRRLMRHMHDQEAGHLANFEALLARHRVRPTAMGPLWRLAATALGWSTALMGPKAAMACTEAVETEIGGHYNGQIRELLVMMRELEAAGQDVGEELRDLVECIRRTRDEELEHLDHAVDHEAKHAEGYALLTSIVRGGCRGAIWISERI